MDLGAGIRIQRRRWQAPVIRDAVRTVLTTPTYHARVKAVSETIQAMDGPATAADRMWDLLRQLPPRPRGEEVA